MAFRGQFDHNLDAKDRLTIPARFRAALADGVVLLEELDTCVSIYSLQAYDRLTERFLGRLSPLSQEGRMMKRRFHARARDETIDSAGRVRLPRHMLEHAGLEGPCVVVGVEDHLEVWEPHGWADHLTKINARADEIGESLAVADEGPRD